MLFCWVVCKWKKRFFLNYYYLLNLVRAISRRHVYDEPQLPSCVLDVLSLELFALGVVGPRQPLVAVKGRVEAASDQNEAPANSFKEKAADQQAWRYIEKDINEFILKPFKIDFLNFVIEQKTK